MLGRENDDVKNSSGEYGDGVSRCDTFWDIGILGGDRDALIHGLGRGGLGVRRESADGDEFSCLELKTAGIVSTKARRLGLIGVGVMISIRQDLLCQGLRSRR